MGSKLRKATLSVLFAGLTAVMLAAPAEANRGGTPPTTQPGYVPPPQYGQNPHPELPDEPDPYAPGVAPTVVPVELPGITDPGLDLAGGGEPLGPVDGSQVQDGSESRPVAEPGGFMGGILSRTGAETLPLARVGVAALGLGLGLIVLARRRRLGAASV